jgi:hypothetical protein
MKSKQVREKEKYKIGKNLRNLLFRSEFVEVLSNDSCIYMGENYIYPKVEHKEVLQVCYKILETLKL